MKKRNIILIILIVVALVMIGSSVVLSLLPNANTNNSNNDNKVPVDADNEIYFIVTNDGNMKTNNSEMLRTDKEKDELYFTEISLVLSDEITEFIANVENIGNMDLEGKSYTLKFVDKNDKVLGEVTLAVPSLKVNEKNIVMSQTKLDIINAYDFIIE